MYARTETTVSHRSLGKRLFAAGARSTAVRVFLGGIIFRLRRSTGRARSDLTCLALTRTRRPIPEKLSYQGRLTQDLTYLVFPLGGLGNGAMLL